MRTNDIRKLLMVCCLMVNLHASQSLGNTNLPSLEEMTTEMMHSSEIADFRGQYASIRESLDYSHHRFYLPSRQRIQDEIIDSYLLHRFDKPCQTPTIIFMAGVMGSGKSHSLRYLDQRDDFFLSDYVVVDPDKIKYQLPEMSSFIAQNPLTAGNRTHKESGYIAEIIQNAALSQHFPIIIDGSLRDKDWNEALILRIRSEYPRYRIGLIYVTASHKRVTQRVKQRELDTGRAINLELLEKTANQVPFTVAHLRGAVDFFLKIENEERPVLLESENLPFRACWTH